MLCHEFLPHNKGTSELYGKVIVKIVSQEMTADLVIRYLELSEYNPRPQSITSRNTTASVTLFHYLHWSKNSTPQGISALLDIMESVNRVQMSSGNKPITVMCQ